MYGEVYNYLTNQIHILTPHNHNTYLLPYNHDFILLSNVSVYCNKCTPDKRKTDPTCGEFCDAIIESKETVISNRMTFLKFKEFIKSQSTKTAKTAKTTIYIDSYYYTNTLPMDMFEIDKTLNRIYNNTIKHKYSSSYQTFIDDITKLKLKLNNYY